jgi:hypothetical protein
MKIKGIDDLKLSDLMIRMIKNAESKKIRTDSVLKENALVGLELENAKVLPKKGEKAGKNRIIVFIEAIENQGEETYLLCTDDGKPLFAHKILDLCRLVAQKKITTASKI